MSQKYKVIMDGTNPRAPGIFVVFDRQTDESITEPLPNEVANHFQWQRYLAWKAKGNEPEPIDAPDPLAAARALLDEVDAKIKRETDFWAEVASGGASPDTQARMNDLLAQRAFLKASILLKS